VVDLRRIIEEKAIEKNQDLEIINPKVLNLEILMQEIGKKNIRIKNLLINKNI
jgi:hypothetical protein